MVITSDNGIFVYGASGHAKVIIDAIERAGSYRIIGLVDDDLLLKGKVIYGYRVYGGGDDLVTALAGELPSRGIVAIGSNSVRRRVSSWLTANGIERVSAIHPSAQIARGVSVGCGSVIMAGAVVNSDTVIGEDVIINTGATVDHDCSIGDGVHIAPGATLCGTVAVGDGTFVCAGAVILPNLTVGSESVVGAGATVVANVPDRVTVVGTPARTVRRTP